MKNLDEIRAVLDSHSDELKDRYGISGMRIFGSYARHEQTENSDLDVIVDFNRRVGLMHVTELQYRLEELLGMDVDVVTRNALKPFMAEHILHEAVPV